MLQWRKSGRAHVGKVTVDLDPVKLTFFGCPYLVISFSVVVVGDQLTSRRNADGRRIGCYPADASGIISETVYPFAFQFVFV